MKIFDTEEELRAWIKERGKPIHEEYSSHSGEESEGFILVYEQDGEHWAVQGWGYYDGMYGTLKPRYSSCLHGEHKGKYTVCKCKIVPVVTKKVELMECPYVEIDAHKEDEKGAITHED